MMNKEVSMHPSEVDDGRITFLVKKVSSITFAKVMNFLDVVVKVSNQETPSWILKQKIPNKLQFSVNKNRKDTLDRKHLRKPDQFRNRILWTDKAKMNLYQIDEKRRVWRKEKLMIPNIPHHPPIMVEAVLWHQDVRLPMELAHWSRRDRSNGMNWCFGISYPLRFSLMLLS